MNGRAIEIEQPIDKTAAMSEMLRPFFLCVEIWHSCVWKFANN